MLLQRFDVTQLWLRKMEWLHIQMLWSLVDLFLAQWLHIPAPSVLLCVVVTRPEYVLVIVRGQLEGLAAINQLANVSTCTNNIAAAAFKTRKLLLILYSYYLSPSPCSSLLLDKLLC